MAFFQMQSVELEWLKMKGSNKASGGNKMNFFEISKEPINTQDVIDKVIQREAGAITTFIGTVRELTHGKKTLFLIYEAYESMAVKKLAQIGQEVEGKWPGTK